MAVTLRRRTLVNPARRRKLSSKQIKYFGTARQKAALRRKRKPTASTHRRRRRVTRSNVGEIITLALPTGNPATKKRSKSMARRKTNSARRRRHNRVHRRRANPVVVVRTKRFNRKRHNPAIRRRRRNPIKLGGIGIPKFVRYGGYTLAGGVGSYFLTKFVLGSRNAGLIGYLGNTLAALVLGQVARFSTKDPMAAAFVTAGGVASVLQRVISEQTSYGKYVSLAGMGSLLPGNFVSPPIYRPDGSTVPPPGWAPVVQLPAAPAAVSGLRGLGSSTYARSQYGK